MTDLDDTMVEDPAHVAGWMISGVALLVAIVTVWILGIGGAQESRYSIF